MALSSRLRSLIDLLPEGLFLSDVGSDHAYLAAYAILEGKAPAAQAIDNKEGPYAHMEKTREELSLEGRLFLSLSSGLSELDQRAEVVVLAGMGGELIADILEEGKDKLPRVSYLLIDAHGERPLLERKLLELGFRPDDGIFMREKGKYYSLERWARGRFDREITAFEKCYGLLPSLKREPSFLAFLEEEKRRLARFLAPGVPQSRQAEALRRKDLIEEYIHENAQAHLQAL